MHARTPMVVIGCSVAALLAALLLWLGGVGLDGTSALAPEAPAAGSPGPLPPATAPLPASPESGQPATPKPEPEPTPVPVPPAPATEAEATAQPPATGVRVQITEWPEALKLRYRMGTPDLGVVGLLLVPESGGPAYEPAVGKLQEAPPGRYLLRVFGVHAPINPRQIPVTVTAGAVTRVPVALQAGATLRVLCVAPDQRPLHGLHVEVAYDWPFEGPAAELPEVNVGTAGVSAPDYQFFSHRILSRGAQFVRSTRQNGRVNFEGMPPGLLRLRVKLAEDQWVEQRVEAGEDVVQVVVPRPPLSLALDLPLWSSHSWHVGLQRSAPDSKPLFRRGMYGQFDFRGLTPGTYVLWARKAGRGMLKRLELGGAPATLKYDGGAVAPVVVRAKWTAVDRLPRHARMRVWWEGHPLPLRWNLFSGADARNWLPANVELRLQTDVTGHAPKEWRLQLEPGETRTLDAGELEPVK